MVHFVSPLLSRAYHRISLTGCILLLVIAFLVAGCSSARFYVQAVTGQMELLAKRQDIEEILLDTTTESVVRRQLEFVQQILDFSENVLFLPLDDRYRSYVQLDRPYLVWNVVAAEEFSVEALLRCYPVAGCAPYRGYFKKSMANQEALRLRRKGYDVYVSGVPAYSTIGWFDDPIVSTFVHWSESNLAELLFHELAHSVLFIPGDSAFNEAFATFVGRRGVALYMRARNQAGNYPVVDQEQEVLFAWLLRWQRELRRIYASGEPVALLRTRKSALLEEINSCYESNKQLLGRGRFDTFMQIPFDNARMATVSTYHNWVPAFDHLFVENDGDWLAFYTDVKALAKLSLEKRLVRLKVLREQEVAQRRDHQSSDNIQCKSLSDHPLHTKFSG